MESDEEKPNRNFKSLPERRNASTRYTKNEMSEMTNKKQISACTVDRLVMDELLEMGFSYNSIGTHYLHESIVASTKMQLEDFTNVNSFCQAIGNRVRRKYGVGVYQYANSIEAAIGRAFDVGNIDYLLNTFKSSYNKDKMKVNKNVFIMTVRHKIIEALNRQETYSATQLRIIIQGTVEGITDYTLLKGICDIVLSVGNKSLV